MCRYCLSILVFLIATLSAKAEFFVIERYDVDIRVSTSGLFEVTETIDVRFSEPRHGIFRNIPYRYRIDGELYRIRLSGVKVEGHPVAERSWKNGQLILRIGSKNRKVDGAQRYVIRYKVRDAWLFLDEHTEFYWNVIGPEWEAPIGEISYRIHLPDAPRLASEDYAVYTGGLGARGQDASIAYRGGVLQGQSTRPFGPREALTAAIRLPVDYIYRPTKTDLFIRHYASGILPLGLLGLLGFLWFRHGRDDSIVKMAQYYPPDDFPPAEAGAFIDDKVDNRDITALIPYWAGQGLMRIREVKARKMLIFSSTDYEFVKMGDLPSDRPAYERTVFEGLFDGGDEVLLSELKDKFYTTMQAARGQLKRSVRDRQLYTSQSRMLHAALPVAGGLCILLAIPLFFWRQFPAAGGMILVGLAAFIMRRPMLKKSKEGMAVYQHLQGFRLFIDKADRPRLERLLQDDSGYFEKTLPFAIAFGMAKKWSKNFEGLFTEPPSWYVSAHASGVHGGMGDFSSFASNFDSSLREIQSAFVSQPSSSGSGGGFGGGGSSGGGFGGGGGGSW